MHRNVSGRTIADRLMVGALLALSLFNAASELRQRFHWPLLAEDDWTRLERDLIRTREALGRLREPAVEYRIEEASETYDSTHFHRLQYILAPSILRLEQEKTRYALVEFWTSRRVQPLPDLILVEDLGHGYGLYRRP